MHDGSDAGEEPPVRGFADDVDARVGDVVEAAPPLRDDGSDSGVPDSLEDCLAPFR